MYIHVCMHVYTYILDPRPAGSASQARTPPGPS